MKKSASLILAFIMVVLFFACQKTGSAPPNDGEESTPPVAGFSTSTTSGDAPVSIDFNDNSTGDITSWLWDFGDGTTSTEKNPSHVYAKLGKYTVKLTVTNADGSDNASKTNAVTVYEIEEYRYSSVGPFYPSRTYGDAEFDGNGPNVSLTVTLLPPVGSVRTGGESLRLKLTMYARETQSDWSTAYGEWYYNIAKLPDNAILKDFLSSTSDSQNYTDYNTDYTISSGKILGDFWSVGDTPGDDICTGGGCGSSDTRLYFKNFYCKVRLAPL